MTDQNPNARRRAVNMLSSVLDKNHQLEDILSENLKGLSNRDRALARAMTSTCLRHLGIIDSLIDKMLDRPLPKAATNIRNVVRIGLAQTLFMDIPAHAAVHDTVELIPANSKFKGLVNALLRRSDRQGAKLLGQMNKAHKNTPDWLWKSWKSHYGAEIAEAIALAHLFEAPLDISVKENPEQWAEKLDCKLLPTGHLRKAAGGAITAFEGFETGDWWIQDFAASLPAKLFGDVSGLRVLDVCAAPGGKTAQLAARGAEVTAIDRSKARLTRLNENMERLNLKVSVKAADATGYLPANPYDAVLLDAPCSSTGTIRRHPDVAWLKTVDDVDKLGQLQSRLLDATISQLKSGGVLVYSTCSLQPEAFLARHPNMKRKPVTSDEVGGLSEIVTEAGDLRCLPFQMKDADNEALGGMDGFFAARLIKD
jgi:16S rRNA (cytosine967-C5)-methyltransferase